MRLMAGAFTQQNAAALDQRDSAARRPRASSTSRISSGPAAPRKADLARRRATRNATAAEMFPAAARRQPLDLLRQAGQRAQRRRRLRRTGAPLPGRAQRIARARGRRRAAAAVRSDLGRRRTKRRAAKVDAATAINKLVRSPASIPTALAFERDANAPVAAPAVSPPASADAGGGMFHSLFQTGERREAVAPAVSELWRPARTNAAQPRRSSQRIVACHGQRAVPATGVTRTSARRSICSATCARRAGGRSRGGDLTRVRALTNRSIIPKIYGERFVKRSRARLQCPAQSPVP